MVISLIGYMGSGKSHVAKILCEKRGLKLIDLDKEISSKSGMMITEIFEKKGELYFRKLEREILQEILTGETDCILSLGGGTPVYYNNMDLINENSKSIYLKTSVLELAQRLSKQKEKRPLIARIPDEELTEFIGKHLFERNPFYAKAHHTINTDQKSVDEVAEAIIQIMEAENV